MEIIGNGVDIIDNSRIKKSIEKKNFVTRIFSQYEINQSKKLKNKANFFAKRFAAKEAFVKSIGSGFRNGINFKDISITNDIFGKPELLVNKKLKNFISKKFKTKNFKVSLSLADEKNHSIAFVIISKSY